MLVGHQSIATYSRRNIIIWVIMAFQAGFLNTGGFMACHTFVSHVTGYATLFGKNLRDKDLFSAIGMLTVPVLFLIGSMLSGFLVDIRLKLNKKPKYYIIFGVMFFLTSFVFLGGVLNFFGPFGEPLLLVRDYILLSMLCLICGIQNGAVTTVSQSVVRTTHLTGVTTDLGLGIMRAFYRDKLPAEMIAHELKANRMRISIISFFILGCIFGAMLFKKTHYYGFGVPALVYGILFVLSYKYQKSNI